jgi:pimeloyl-ACP methyl ester carboxylesterase
METVQSADGTTIAWEHAGQGPALVVVAGAFCDRQAGATLAACLESSFTVYRYDRRGRGASSDTAPYTIQREVEDLAAVVATAGGAAVVYGHSSGAALALEAAAAGVNISALAAYEPPYAGGHAPPIAGDAPADLAEQLRALVRAGRADEAAARFLAVTGTPPQVVSQIQAGPGWPGMVALAHTLAYDVTLGNGGVPPVDRLAKVTARTLALAGGASPPWAAEAARTIAATVPGADHRVLTGQHHVAADDVLAPVLHEFFTRAPSS